MDDGATPPGTPAGGKRVRVAGEDDWIRSQLRRVYDATVGEQIPDEMMDLLRQLDQIPVPTDREHPQQDSRDAPHESEGPR